MRPGANCLPVDSSSADLGKTFPKVMPKRPCIGRRADGSLCGALTEGDRCPAHERKPWQQRSPSSRATARPGWTKLRDLALQRDGQCVRCGATEALAVHHRVGVAEGGAMSLDNLSVLCERCHGRAHGRTAA